MLTYLIDDDIISLFLTEQMLRLGGFKAPILPFVGAAEALAYMLPRLATEPPQVIFLDLNMPVMDGWHFLEALAPHTSVLQGCCRIYLLTSSLALADTAKASDEVLVAGVIHKPIDDEGVRAILANTGLPKVARSAPNTEAKKAPPSVTGAEVPHLG